MMQSFRESPRPGNGWLRTLLILMLVDLAVLAGSILFDLFEHAGSTATRRVVIVSSHTALVLSVVVLVLGIVLACHRRAGRDKTPS